MPRKIMIDADVIGAINRGNKEAARALRKMIDSGATIHIGNWQYGELTGDPEKIGRGPSSPQTRAADKRLLEDLGIGVLPLTGKVNDRMKLHDQIGRHGGLQPGEIMLLAEAWVHGYEIFSYDKAFRKHRKRTKEVYGVIVAEESERTYSDQLGKRDYREARKNLRLGEILVLPNGQIMKPPKKKPPSGSGGHTGSSGGPKPGPAGAGTPGGDTGAKARPKATTGVPDKGPTVLGPPSQTKGQKIEGAVELALAGYNFIVQKVNDSIQADRMKEQWTRIKPNVEQRLADDPTLGALILVRFAKRAKQGAEHESPLEHTNRFLSIHVAYGANESEAWASYRLQARIDHGAHGDVSIQDFFMPPKKPLDVRNLRTPFRKHAVGTFVPGRAGLMRVAWKGVFGFDEIGDVKLDVPADVSPRFLLLDPPDEIEWSNGRAQHTTDIPSEFRDAASAELDITRSITVVDMDAGIFNWGSDAAAMVFPADPTTERLFDGVARTKDTTGQLRYFVNFDKLRWVRASNIHILRKFPE